MPGAILFDANQFRTAAAMPSSRQVLDRVKTMPFANRSEAGKQLSVELLQYRTGRPVVLALPRGGVPVAAEIAAALNAPLDLLLVRKIGVPMQPELAMGAVVDGAHPIVARNEDENGRGAWLSNEKQVEDPFVLVIAEFLPEVAVRFGQEPGKPHATLAPFAHIGIELPTRILFGKPEVDGRHEKVRVLAARKIRNDEHDPADADPPRNMHARFRRAENGIDKTCDGHERVSARGEAIGLTHQMRNHMHNDKHANDQRIFFLPACFDLFVQ